MSKKDAREYRRQRQAEISRHIREDKDRPLLDLMGQLRPYTYGAAILDDPRSLAFRKLQSAIDDVAEVVTGDRGYFAAKHHSIG